MKVNRKLTKLITGRTMKSFDLKDNLLIITFEDDSIIKIKTPLAELPGELQPSKIKDVYQDDNVIEFEYEDKTKADIKLAEPASSVMLRDGKGVMEYAD